MCKHSNVLSRPVLMGRGLDGYFCCSSVAVYCAVIWGRRERAARGGLSAHQASGGNSEGETPLPISNREVKPLSADGTWLARAWESRSPPVFLSRPPAMAASFAAPSRRFSHPVGLNGHGDPCSA